jgi:hypothetical protein
MPAFLLTPIARWAALAALIGAVALWGWAERAGRQVAALEAQAAEQRADAAEARIKHMETANAEADRARRDPNPIGSLRDEWTRD